MSVLDSLDDNVVVEQEDKGLGGSFVAKSGVYKAKVIEAWIYPSSAEGSKSKALALRISTKEKLNDNEWVACPETVTTLDTYFLSKTGKGTYSRKDDATGEYKDLALPNRSLINSLTELYSNEKFDSKINLVNKNVEFYDFKEGKIVTKEFPSIKGLLSKEIVIGLIEKEYPSAKGTKTKNMFTNVFSSTGHTFSETKAKSEALFMSKWNEKFSDTVEPADGSAPTKRVEVPAEGDTKEVELDIEA